jgi:hypothetical protein
VPTQYSTNTEKTHTHIHALSVVQKYDPSVWAVQDSSCFRLCGTQIFTRSL